MSWMKRTALALAAGAAFSLTAEPSSAAPVSQVAGAVPAAIAQTDNSLVEVGRRRGRHYGHWRGHRHGHRRYGRRHHGIPWFLFAAPFIFDGYGHHRHHHHRRYY